MVGVQFNGRLGNQIFQYAFYQYLKTNNKRIFFFFSNPTDSYLTKYFDIDRTEDYCLTYKALFIVPKILNKILASRQIYIQNIQIPKPVSVRNWTIYKGFFQTDWYVKNIVGEFGLKIKQEYQQKFDEKFGEVFKLNKTIAVHIRRTDYLKYGKRDISLPIAYFKSRLDALQNIDDYKIFFVSDDIAYVSSYFGKNANYIFSENDEITDFQIIKAADISIISNSSFAWWACYLSANKRKITYAPKNWLGFRIGKEHPKKVMTDRFIWCDVQ
ncbi:alpha-1,2-fucosyltransferase [Pedobacter heparinus]|uniref:Glycosyl transferase family 11 n=1 Tax=Pedobacter heparinus (strain ATCC 13125 / DSM 2366 / CIP 104194 / JCM 7457 / NBRC 12017 / NCIMB 9290 / NRRL B-14731 / HIM 762-3) TaxID=485917 RepID=C6XWA0_PEDHD|nr:alpha-1,2-fucosyltransferase [Pedobacter heparinus]ACU04179.1 glycosyl transferase family 11 [Pedobacter heparinus DSM 2366]